MIGFLICPMRQVGMALVRRRYYRHLIPGRAAFQSMFKYTAGSELLSPTGSVIFSEGKSNPP